MFIKATFGKEEIYLQLFVDDFIFGSPFATLMEKCETFLEKKFIVEVTGDLKKFISLEIHAEKQAAVFNQKGSIFKLDEQH